MNRREFFAQAAAVMRPSEDLPWPPKVSLFSKHVQWLGVSEAAAFARQIGFDAIDLTVRPGGHVSPESAAQQLPRAAEAIRREGVELSMITTAIQGVETPHADAVLQAAASCGVKYFRWGGWKYTDAPVHTDIIVNQARAQRLSKLAERHGLCGIYHTHSGWNEFGASIWDIVEAVEGIDSRVLAINFDIGHATVEGGYGGWRNSARRCGPYLRGVAVKDFVWQRNDKGQWRPQWCPIGEGMAPMREFAKQLRHERFQGPLQLHFEYPMGGAEHGSAKVSWSRERIAAAIQTDLERLRALLL